MPVGYGAGLGTIALLFLLAVAIARTLPIQQGPVPGAYPTMRDTYLAQLAQFIAVLGLTIGCFSGATIVMALTHERRSLPTLLFGALFLTVGFAYAVTRPQQPYGHPLGVLWTVELTALTAWVLFGVGSKVWAERQEARLQAPPRWRWLPGWMRMVLGYLVGLALIIPAIYLDALLALGPGHALSTAGFGLVKADQPAGYLLVGLGLILPRLLVAPLLAAIVALIAGGRGALHGLLFGLIPASNAYPGLVGYGVVRSIGSAKLLGLILAAQPLVLLLACWAGGALAAWLFTKRKAKAVPVEGDTDD